MNKITHPTAPLTLTVRQRQVLDYLRVLLHTNHQLPACSKLADDFGWTSANAASDMMKQLETRGALQRNEVGGHMLTPAAMAGDYGLAAV
jgi:SOS-response transcriptional repressor LexA